MTTYNVFKHPTRGFEAVKVGVSWPAFFCTFVWLLVKRLWGWAAAWFMGAWLLSIMDHVAGQPPTSDAQVMLSLLVAVGWFALAFTLLFKGNKWREANLGSRGYDLVATVTADTVDAAVAQAAKAA